MAREQEFNPSGKVEGDQAKRSDGSGDAANPHKDKPAGKDFGADDDTPQQGGM